MIACDWRIAALITSLGQHFYVGNFVLLMINAEQLFGKQKKGRKGFSFIQRPEATLQVQTQYHILHK